ncbi:alpha/beta fold hydrolase [Brevundimonas subvibrioides]|uniref:Alpha/beta hydrolase fold protein n=1 Tax=Brevundimonas subvibrioides (strain ATCC 15264 / DSM 4735 / LMG 14903 / NBRC 16000 / CB 81) TaxID=633149 RepID=D9QL71_BRESC|nr:alpha/beta hydrolase [Brevundimonas subvibrioides]ADK99926.1 alpha/beta hydrolase fold protein [Brevundimonas subvibrioides ATCC 15264]
MRRFLLLILALLTLPGMAVAQARPFTSDRIVVTVQGSGPDVILIPGLASTGEVWRRTADRLDDGHRVHIVSVRGFGDVPSGANTNGALVAPVASELRRYIAETRLDRPALIGHSMGGLVALRAAADAGRDRRGGTVGRVMVVDATPFFPSLISPGATVGDVEPIARIAYQALLFLGDEALRMQGSALGDQLGGASDSVFSAVGWQGGDRQVLAQGLYEVMTTDLRSRLPDITAPVTVVYGWSADDRSPRSQLDGLFQAGYRNLPRPARFERIEGAEHMVMIDQPGRFLAAVTRFLG